VALGHVHALPVKRPDGTTARRKFFIVVGTGVIFSLKGDPTKTPLAGHG
jgi:hypothetical protein